MGDFFNFTETESYLEIKILPFMIKTFSWEIVATNRGL